MLAPTRTRLARVTLAAVAVPLWLAAFFACDSSDSAPTSVSTDGGGTPRQPVPDAGVDSRTLGPSESEAGATEGSTEGGNDAGKPVEITAPPPVVGGNITLTCTVTCDGQGVCGEATLFVSACAPGASALCYDVKPVGPSGDGNTYIVSVDDEGTEDVIESATCTTAGQSKDGLPVDLLFVIDTTSSMTNAIDGVKSSINAFIDDLAKKKVQARIGGIAFGNTAPLANCLPPDAPYSPFTPKFGTGTESDTDSFNYWVDNLSQTHCGDVGGTDIPENGLDALGFALNGLSGGPGNQVGDAGSGNVFQWSKDSLHVVIFITDAVQHQTGYAGAIGHHTLSEIEETLGGRAVVHVVGPNYGCYNTPAAGCACNVTAATCDVGCACDLLCPAADCADDKRVGVCDVPGSECDLDCPGYGSSSCDVRVGYCDLAGGVAGAAPCASDVDCASGQVLNAFATRRCSPRSQAPYADVGELSLATGGAFTTLPTDGKVDLTKLPLGGVLAATSQCKAKLPDGAEAVRCVYIDDEGHKGEVRLDLKNR